MIKIYYLLIMYNMYNMDISILGYKFNLLILILICVVYLILVGHTFCSCCNPYRIIEGLDSMVENNSGIPNSNIVSNVAFRKIIKTATDAIKEITPPPPVKTEGFVGANTNNGQSSPYDLGDYNVVDASSWSQPNLTIRPGQKISKGAESILNRPKQPIPLPDGELLMFANTDFKPECCPNTFSNGSGCACMTVGQYNYLNNRGGNNVPYSEY